MMKHKQYFTISPQKPIYKGGHIIYRLGVIIESELTNASIITEEMKLWSLYLDYAYTSEKDTYPLFLLPSQDLLDIIDKNKDIDIKYNLSFEQIVYREKINVKGINGDTSYCDTLPIDDSTFFELLSNELHFNDEVNMPCEEIEL
ncbi:hypothetical protein [Mammaliicoccus sciuri]|uniref:hypothetical protein n=2 Tax=Mammaliicoccus sciuri TaxID=1296 RepID=UPI001952723F|nr:hypothetical protein [Mammaliicoccus sciuri]MEB5648624.1 hypothetical protein [Mammaliicoccus sciuri]